MEEPQDDVFARLNAAIEDWNAQLASSHNRLTEKITSAREHLREMLDAEDEDTDSSSSMDTATALAAALEEAAALRGNLTDAEARIEALDAELNGARTALELSDTADTIAGLESDLARMRAADQSPDAKTAAEQDALETELEELRAQLAEVQQEHASVAQALEASKGRVRNLLEEQKETTVLRGEVELLRSQLASKEEALALDTAERRAIEAEQKVAALQGENKRLVAELDGLKQERDNAVKALEDAKHDTHSVKLARASRVAGWMAKEAKSTAPNLDKDPFGSKLEEDVSEPRPIATRDARGQRRRMGEILVDAGLITREQLDSVLEEQKGQPPRRFGMIVVEKGFADEESIAHVLAAQLGMPYADLSKMHIDGRAVTLLTGKMARTHLCVPISRQVGMGLRVAFANPLDLIAMENVERVTGCKVEPVVATPSDIESVLRKYFPNVH